MKTIPNQKPIVAGKSTIATKLTLLLVGFALLGFCLFMLLPWKPGGFLYDLDGSWANGMHVIFRDKIQFGRDFIYTYGPYGFLQVNLYYPETYSYLFIFRFLIAVATWAGLFRIVRHCVSLGKGSTFFLLPVLVFFPAGPIWMDLFQFTLLALLPLIYFYVSKKIGPALVMTIVIAALASLTKLSYMVVCVGFLILITLDEGFNLKRFPRIIGIYLAFIVAFWLIAAQNLTDIPLYLINGLQIIKGFGANMGTPGRLSEVLIYVFGVGTFLSLVGIVELKNKNWWRILPVLSFVGLFFIVFKGAFTRHDSHALQAFFNATPTILITTALLWSKIIQTKWNLNRKLKVPAIAAVVIYLATFFSLGAFVLNNHVNYGYSGFAQKIGRKYKVNWSGTTTAFQGKADFTGISETTKAQVQGENPLPPIEGTVDLYPDEIGTIFAYDFDYQPRPIFQSFSAYTSKLAEMNLAHLKSENAAENILFDLKPIDGRYASFGDALSWPEILTRYDVANIEGRYLHLKRNERPREYQLQPLVDNVQLAIGEWYKLPLSEEPIWAKIDIHPNILGKVATTALRLPRLHLEVETIDGEVSIHRVMGDVMRGGFLLSPKLSDRWDFLDLTSDKWQEKLANKSVARIRITAEGANAKFYPAKYQVNLSQLEFERQDFSGVASWQDWSDRLIPQVIAGGLRRVAIEGVAETVWYSHAPSRMAIAVKDNSQKFDFGFGILDEVIENSTTEQPHDGVEFRIIAQEGGAEKVLFERKLNPVDNLEDRGMQQGTIDLQQVESGELILETTTGDTSLWDWSYWSDFSFN